MTENNDFNNIENERYILTEQFNGLQGVTFVKDECVDVDTYYTVDGAVDLLNEQNETIQRLEAQLSHLQYRFFEYRNRVGKE